MSKPRTLKTLVIDSINLQSSNKIDLRINDNLLLKIKDFLLGSSSIYSDIDSWWDNSVIAGLVTGERVCNLVFDDDEIVALSIGKRSKKSAKLCTLKVNETYRNLGVGDQLLSLTSRQLFKSGCKNIHFTISDEIQSQVGNYFTNYGFKRISWEKNRYEAGHEESVFSGSIGNILKPFQNTYFNMLQKIALFSIQPKYADLITERIKTVELRRRFSTSNLPMTAYFYVCSPRKEISFCADINNAFRENLKELWTNYYRECGVDEKSFNLYFQGAESGWAIPLSNVRTFCKPLHLEDPKFKFLNFKPPQSYTKLNSDSQFAQVLSNLHK